MQFASVCVLSYERLQFLKQCIASIITVGYAPLELIVHDDGSEDPELRDWLVRMSNTGVISTLLMNSPGHNEGQGIAMNRMAAVAKGDPIIKCDQDMVLKPGWLKEVNAVLESNRDAFYGECAHGACPKPDECLPDGRPCEDGVLIGALGVFRYPVEPVRFEDMLIADHPAADGHRGWQEHRDFVGSFIAMPRIAWETFGPWDERSAAFAEDYAYKMKVAAAEGWCCALTTEEMGSNQGFGVGPSTVVTAPGTVAEIKPGPRIHEPEGV